MPSGISEKREPATAHVQRAMTHDKLLLHMQQEIGRVRSATPEGNGRNPEGFRGWGGLLDDDPTVDRASLRP